MKISKEFSKYAGEYESLNTIQNQVVQKLLSLVKGEPKKILDLGCGSGAICKSITWKYDNLCGIDFAQGMIDLHPKSSHVELMNADFNDIELFEVLKNKEYEYVLSASALQWAQNLENVFKNICLLNTPVAFAIFAANTFRTLNETASIESILKTSQEIQLLQQKYFDANFEIVEYRLEFENVREMFRYIKRSGVSGSRNLLSIKQMKELMRLYPLSYLEFEVVFISS
jgi:malonyl-CoA O-methyltransferase